MELYKYETHLHTSEASGCAFSGGAEMADAHKSAGYTGIIVTDHFFNGNSSVPADLPWREKIEIFCSGYENAKKRGDEIGLQVFFGWEFCSEASEFLTYGLDKQWLMEHPEIMDMRIYDYLRFIRRFGGFTVHAHPFRQRSYIKKLTLVPDETDAVEVFNAANDDSLFNDRAVWYANNYNFPVTAGSDTHSANKLLGSGVLSSVKFTDIQGYISAVKNRGIEIIQ